MKIITVNQAQEGLVLARPVEDRLGRTLLRKGEILTPAIIDRLESFGIQNLSIQTDIAPPEEIIPAPEITPDTRQSMRILTELDIRFRGHPDNPRMTLLKQAAMAALIGWDKANR